MKKYLQFINENKSDENIYVLNYLKNINPFEFTTQNKRYGLELSSDEDTIIYFGEHDPIVNIISINGEGYNVKNNTIKFFKKIYNHISNLNENMDQKEAEKEFKKTYKKK